MLLLLAVNTFPASTAAQVPVEATLAGRVLLGDTVLPTATVVLHRVGETVQGEIDSTRVAPDGSFSIRLPSLPNPAVGEAYFASVLHQGVVYFGPLVEAPVQLDSAYVIQAYDTLVAPADGAPVALQGRSLFIEPSAGAWVVTDLFQLRNDAGRTIVAPPGGYVWRYPLPEGAKDVRTEGEMFPNVASFENGEYVVRAALPPGERMFVVQYGIDSLGVSFPTPGLTEAVDVLIREPAPPLELPGLARVESVEMDPGETFRRFAAEDLAVPAIRMLPGEEESRPPVRWIAAALALVLTAGGLLALRGSARRPAAAAPVGPSRQEILLQLARLDEEHEGSPDRSEAAAAEYRRRRTELLRRLEARS